MLITVMGLGIAIISIGSYSAIYATNKKLSKTFVGRYAITDLPLSSSMLKASKIEVFESHHANSTIASHISFNSAYDALMYVSSRLQQMNLLYVDVFKFDDGSYYIENLKPSQTGNYFIKSPVITVSANKI